MSIEYSRRIRSEQQRSTNDLIRLSFEKGIESRSLTFEISFHLAMDVWCAIVNIIPLAMNVSGVKIFTMIGHGRGQHYVMQTNVLVSRTKIYLSLSCQIALNDRSTLDDVDDNHRSVQRGSNTSPNINNCQRLRRVLISFGTLDKFRPSLSRLTRRKSSI